MNRWSVIFVTLSAACAHFRSDPWWSLGAEAQVTVVNRLNEPCAVILGTQDGQRRSLGTVAPADSMTWTLPFADQTVAVWVCGLPTPLTVDRPERHRLIATYRADSTKAGTQ